MNRDRGMDSDQGKLFIGGISWETTEEKLKDHFEVYGDVLQTVVMRDKTNGRPRGFGFVVFADPAILDRVLQDRHTIEGKTVEAKRALSRDEQQTTPSRALSNINGTGRNFGTSGSYRTKKIFVGGLLPTLTEEGFRHYFESYGSVSDVVIMYDQQTQRPRGFGFISFENEDTVDRVLQKNFHDLNGKMVEVKRALPKDANPSGGRAGGYQGYGFSGAGNSGSYDGRISLNRYMHSQSTFPPYGSSGYGYGASNNYSGYGSYVGSPAAAGPRGSWNSRAPSGYGHVGYGNAGGGLVSANMGQSPGIYFGGYGGNNGSYGNQAAYGINVGGRTPSSNSSALVEMHGNFGGYIGGVYGGGYGGTPVPAPTRAPARQV